MRISDWSSDVCSSDLQHLGDDGRADRTEPLAVFPDLRLFQDVVPERRCLVQALLLRHLAVRAGRNLVWRERVGDTDLLGDRLARRQLQHDAALEVVEGKVAATVGQAVKLGNRKTLAVGKSG